ncbi:MAG: hypothetical protein WC107_00590 [Patescibacteria group bacterium]
MTKLIKKIIILLLLAFGAFVVGRIGHILGGDLNVPHHWIYGAIAIIAGIIYRRKRWAAYLIAIGVGLMISDFKDMIDLKFIGSDLPGPKTFWQIN